MPDVNPELDPAAYPPSPVSSDARLCPGELPFTAFGQFGVDSLDLRVLDQDTYWIDRHGRAQLLSEMSAEFLENVIAFLSELRDQYFAEASAGVHPDHGHRLLFGDPGGEALAAAVGARSGQTSPRRSGWRQRR